jgi:hypothetical protein
MWKQRAYGSRLDSALEVSLLTVQRGFAIMLGLTVMLTASTTPMQFDFGIEGIIEAGHCVTPIEQGAGVQSRAAIMPTRKIVKFLSTNQSK